jgi:DNA-binding NtrC family response regulator
VADMPMETQGKIVRALQDQAFQRVGGSSRVSVDVRVIATTNRDLQAEIAAGRFREDLFYRLSVVPLLVPALRQRRDDVPMLAEYFLRRAAENAGMAPRELAPDAIAALQAYDWPGNVRQLRNLMDWLLIDPRRRAAAGSRGSCAAASVARFRGGYDGADAARGPRPVRDPVSTGATDAAGWQYQPDGSLRGDGAQRAPS